MRKYNKVVINKVKDWLYEEGFECDVQPSNSYDYDMITDTIGLPKRYDLEARYFMEHLYEGGLKYEVDEIVMSILHEVGHSETMDFDMTEDELYNDYLCKCLIELGDTDSKDAYEAYWGTKVERLANEWAIMFANDNIDSVRRLERMLLPITDWDFMEV